MQIVFLIYIHKKNHARIEIYIFLAQIMENERMHTAKMKCTILPDDSHYTYYTYDLNAR